MLRITDGKGFHITFNNGYSISVQFGIGNYCGNRDFVILRNGKDLEACNIEAGEKGSWDCEIAILDPQNNLIQVEEWGDEVKGWVTPNELVKWMEYTSKL